MLQPLRRSLLRGLLAATAVNLRVAHAGNILAASPISRMDLPWWRRRFEEKQAQLRQGAGLLWLGDSITQNWEKNGPEPWADFAPMWQRYYGRWNPVNLGFMGDTTANLLWRLREMVVSPSPPRAAIMLIGANNFGRVHWSAEATIAGVDADLATLRRRLPKTPVLLLSVLPSGRGPWVAAQTDATNRALRTRYGTAGDVVFQDVTPLFMHNGELDTAKYYDPLLNPPAPPLHPTAQAMAALAKVIEPSLARFLA